MADSNTTKITYNDMYEHIKQKYTDEYIKNISEHQECLELLELLNLLLHRIAKQKTYPLRHIITQLETQRDALRIKELFHTMFSFRDLVIVEREEEQ